MELVAPAPAAAPPRRAVYRVEAGERLPVAYVDRPLTYGAGTLYPFVDFAITHPEILGGGGRNVTGNTIGSMTPGVGYSITDDFSIHGELFTLQFNDPFQLAAAGIGGTYRFIKGSFELGVGLDFIYQTPSNGNGFAGVDILPGVPMRVHLGHVARLDITPTLPISTAGFYAPGVGGLAGGETTVGLYVPIGITFQPIEQLFLGVGSGFDVTFNPHSTALGNNLTVGDTFWIPLGFQVGVSIPGPKGPILDMEPYFLFPGLFVPGIQNGLNAVQSGLWVAGLNFTTYFYL